MHAEVLVMSPPATSARQEPTSPRTILCTNPTKGRLSTIGRPVGCDSMMKRHTNLVGLIAVLGGLVLAGCTGSSGGVNPVDTAVGWITGLVTKSRGEPIANATVTLLYTGEQAITDDQGRFNIQTREPGVGQLLRTEAEGYLHLDWSVASGSSTWHLRLVSLDDFNDPLFRELTGASDTVGTWRFDWPAPIYVDRSGPWRPEFDLALRDAYNQWGMLIRSTLFGETAFDNWKIHLSYVNEAPCGVLEAAGCAGILSVTPYGAIEATFIELHAGYGIDVGLVVHEMGHTMGLLGHSQNPNDIMYTVLNGMTSPSNREAAVASVLYYNPPGTTMEFLRFPPLSQLASEASTSAAVPSGMSASPATVLQGSTFVVASSPPHPNVVSMPPSGLRAVADIAAMVRDWFGGNGCFLNLPLFCNLGPAIRIW